MTVINNKTAYIGSTMDIPHYGHMLLIQTAAKYADKVVVVLNTDEFVERFKHKTPILTLEERMKTVSMIKGVDYVDVNVGGEDSKPSILKWKPDYIVFGDDYDIERYKKQIGVDDKFLADNNINLMQIPYTKEISTTNIIERCRR